jgi:hypothetical protein
MDPSISTQSSPETLAWKTRRRRDDACSRKASIIKLECHRASARNVGQSGHQFRFAHDSLQVFLTAEQLVRDDNRAAFYEAATAPRFRAAVERRGRLSLMAAQDRGATPAEEPTLAELIEALDPEVRAAIDDVDRTLIELSLQQSPWDRLTSASRMAQYLARIRDATASEGD